MEQQLLQTGEETISKLAGRAAEVQGLVSANFAAKSLADVQASFEAAFASGAPAAVNAEVVKVHTIVREQAAQAVEDLKAVEMWLQIKTPEIADGNNFGVEVQAFVAGELKAMRTEMLGLVDGLSAYHLLRGTTVEKMTKAPSKSTDEETKVAVEGDKTTNSHRGMWICTYTAGASARVCRLAGATAPPPLPQLEMHSSPPRRLARGALRGSPPSTPPSHLPLQPSSQPSSLAALPPALLRAAVA